MAFSSPRFARTQIEKQNNAYNVDNSHASSFTPRPWLLNNGAMLMMLLLFAMRLAAAFKAMALCLFEATPALLFFKNLVLRLFLLPLSPPKIPKLVVIEEQHFWWRCAFADDAAAADDDTHTQPSRHRWWWKWKWRCVFFPKSRIFFAVKGVPLNPPPSKPFSLKKVRSSFPFVLKGRAEKAVAGLESVVILSTLSLLNESFFSKERWLFFSQKGGKKEVLRQMKRLKIFVKKKQKRDKRL